MRTVTLEDRYTATEGPVLLSGIHALVRVMLEQRRLDTRLGLRTAAYVSGYQGSPLGGLDKELDRTAALREPLDVVFHAGLNEELAATAVGGTQLLGELGGRRHDGVTGWWYGKNPGLDRAADAIRHANVSGTAPLGGAVALIGDDPSCKSSTLPSSCEPMCRSLALPLLAPGSVGEILELGLHAVALSRETGSWAALKIVADIADASATVDVTGLQDRFASLAADPEHARPASRPPVLLPPTSVDAEADLLGVRLDRARAYGRRHRLNRVAFEPASGARLGLVAAGTAFSVLERTLRDAGLEDAALDQAGIRLIKISMPFPLDRDDAIALTAGLDEVIVLEDKLPFLETQLKELLYGRPGAPRILGERDEDDRPLVPVRGALGAADVARVLATRLHHEGLAHLSGATPVAVAGLPVRTPYFCSGCPHSRSTKAGDDQLVGVGIGCHTMVALDPAGGRGQLVGMTQMGGEGAQWLGLEPFTDDAHFTQNIGDGTFHHSGSLAIRAAVAAGADITYRLLYNDAVAMTGGQRPEGRMDVPAITRLLAEEGVRQVIVTTDDLTPYRGVALAPIASVRHRDELEAAQAELAAAGGVTVLIHDDRCATEERRLRKRGVLPTPAERIWINERVCEGCGDCGEKSTCLSVAPVPTEFGRKTRIHQSSCNQDRSCLDGDCPSFVVVKPGAAAAARPAGPPALPVAALPDPVRRVGDDVLIRMPGVGGTGVVTISQVLQMAAHLDGAHAAGLEQTGLAQKGGPVVSDVRISRTPIDGALAATLRSVDVLLGFDLLGAAAPATLAVCDPVRTVAVISTSEVPTAAMVTDPSVPRAPGGRGLRRIERATRPGETLHLDAQALSETLFGDHLSANMVLVGAAFQHGCLPIGADAIEAAITLNGAAVSTNLAAFAWGRAAVADPGAVAAATAPAALPEPEPDPRAAAILGTLAMPAGSELRRLLDVRVADLAGYQDAAYAGVYAERVAAVHARAGAAIAEPYARGLHKLMAYKDEYEVARLHLDALESARRDAAFGAGAKAWILLHPPLLRALGMRRKLRVGAWARPAFQALAAGRRLRGTRLDPFGLTSMRRLERALVGEYVALVEAVLEHLSPETAGPIAELAALPDVIRGYEAIKLANVERFRARAAELTAAISQDAAAAAGDPRFVIHPRAGAVA